MQRIKSFWKASCFPPANMQMWPGLSGLIRKAAAGPARRPTVSIPADPGLGLLTGALVRASCHPDDLPCPCMPTCWSSGDSCVWAGNDGERHGLTAALTLSPGCSNTVPRSQHPHQHCTYLWILWRPTVLGAVSRIQHGMLKEGKSVDKQNTALCSLCLTAVLSFLPGRRSRLPGMRSCTSGKMLSWPMIRKWTPTKTTQNWCWAACAASRPWGNGELQWDGGPTALERLLPELSPKTPAFAFICFPRKHLSLGSVSLFCLSDK